MIILQYREERDIAEDDASLTLTSIPLLPNYKTTAYAVRHHP